MRLILMFGALVAMGYGAAAESYSDDGYIVKSETAPNISEQFVKCWSVPAGVAFQNLTASLDVEFGNSGDVIDITSKVKTPKDHAEKLLIISASRAIERCSPFNSVPAGTHEITIAPTPKKKPINPFK